MAIALVAAAKLQSIEPSTDVNDYQTHPGEGVSATVDGKKVEVGNARFGTRLGWFENIPREQAALGEVWERAGGTVGYLAPNPKP